jgi:hypothetical protein
MSLERGGQIYERRSLKELACVVERAAGAKDLRLLHVIEFDAEATAIAQGSLDRLGPMVQVHHNLIDTVAGEIFSHVANERFSKNRYRGFSAVFGEWPEACAVTGGKNNRAHQPYRSGSLGGIAHDEVESSRGDLAKARIAIERHGDADGRILSRELETTFK